MLKGIFLAVFCSILLFLSHFIILSLRKKEYRYLSPIHQLLYISRVLIKICAGLTVIYTLLFFLIPDNYLSNLMINYSRPLEIFAFFYGIFLYIYFLFLYLVFYFIVDRSVSATIMINVKRSSNKRLTSEQIEEIYDIDRKYLNELKGMLEGKFITETGVYFSNTTKGHLYACLARFLKGYFKLGPGG